MNAINTGTMNFSDNPEMAAADAFIRQTGCHLFLTGKAGSGKTTFLRHLQKSCPKQMVITAPTGVAAINAGGVTLHSFFQLPFGPFLPGQSEQDRQRLFRMSKEKKRIIKGLDLLVIDEISMVRADTLDAVDHVLRQLRRSSAPFGGVQLLLIGDLYQLPPVAKPEEWQLLQGSYPSVYFFASQALASSELVTIELLKVYRQSDENFIRVLNAVRENRLDGPAAEMLNQCVHKQPPGQGYITLTTHNYKADQINGQHLNQLSGGGQAFQAEVTGEFPAHAFPTADHLVLKKGAQVMFLRNDPSPERAYYNGKIGRITAISRERIQVTCDPEEGEAQPRQIEVEPVEWQNINYKVNEADSSIEEEVIGQFRQVPLKLAWAVTIHKSQGLTFDRAIVDAVDAFTHGQTYVALSRCRSLEGLVLSSPIPAQGLQADPVVNGFMAELFSTEQLKQRFVTARVAWQRHLLLQCFDCSTFQGLFNYLIRLLESNHSVIQVTGIEDITNFKRVALEHIFTVSDKFLNQLQRLTASGGLPALDPVIVERTRKASTWFGEQITAVFGDFLDKGAVVTDNKALAKQINNAITNLKQAISIQKAGILSCSDGFSPEVYLSAISRAGVASMPGKLTRQKKPKAIETELDIEHIELFKLLEAWRNEQALAEERLSHRILRQKLLYELATYLPTTESELRALKSINCSVMEKYGSILLSIIRAYREEHGITQVDLPKEKVEQGLNTRAISLNAFMRGLSPEAIAKERELTLNTVFGHLISYIETGELEITSLVDAKKQELIKAEIENDLPLGQLKERLGDGITYGEIKAVLAHQSFLAL